VQSDKPQSKSEKVATVEEISEAIEKVSPEGWAKIYAFAKNRARFMALYGGAVDGPDLVQQAIVALLQDRRTWKPSQVNFVGLLTGAIRSIASNHKAKSLSSGYSIPESQIAPTDDGDESEALTSLRADSRSNQEETMIQAEREAKNVVRVEELYGFFDHDKETCDVMDGWRAGMSGTEIIEVLEIDRKGYETIAKRIRRKSVERWSKVNTHVS
jgi:DNA-directed RNA polymerase specialized sigma24 family protein